MRTHKVMTAALALALALCAVVVMTASAAPPAPNKVQVKAKAATVKYIGERQFAATPKAPAKNGPDTPQLATNRAIPSKTSKAKSPTQLEGLFPTVMPTKVDSSTPSHLKASKGLNAYDTWQANDIVYQPPDQGLCAGNGYVLEMVNMVLAIYDGNLNKITGDTSLDHFFGLPYLGSTGDPKCYYDPGSKRFFATQISMGGKTPATMVRRLMRGPTRLS